MPVPVTSRVDQCKVIWYQWANDITDDTSIFTAKMNQPSVLAEAKAYDISEHILECSFNKTLGEAAGAFSITLASSRDWSRIMKPGEWVTIYMTGEGDLPMPGSSPKPSGGAGKAAAVGDKLKGAVNGLAGALPGVKPNPTKVDLPKPAPGLKSLGKRLRGVCLIQRVAIKSVVSPDGSVSQTYEVTGKDFGVCLEETDLWFNFLLAENSTFKNVVESLFAISPDPSKNIRNLSNLMDTYFQAFFQPAKLFGQNVATTPGSLGEAQQQWLLPDTMIKDLGLSVAGDPYFGNVDKIREFHQTIFENNMQAPLVGLEGSAWSRMKSLSQPEFHELFTEIEDDGKLKIHFRPIPWAINKERYPNVGKFMQSYADLVGEEGQSNLDNVAGAVKAAAGFFTDPIGSAANAVSTKDFRKDHRVSLSASEIYTFDIGPDFHNRYNHFLITANNNGQKNFSELYSIKSQKRALADLPFRNDASIKRHGLRARHFETMSFLTNSAPFPSGTFKNNPQLQFMLELNEIMRDFWGQAGEFYSGTFNIAGKNKTKLGKVLVTDDTVDGAARFVFYIESYSDSFSVDPNGTGEWNQTIAVTRGIELKDLQARSGFGRKDPLKKIGSFVKN